MSVLDFINLCDFPDSVDFELYDYDLFDDVFLGKCDTVPEIYYHRIVKGFEIQNNKLILNLKSEK